MQTKCQSKLKVEFVEKTTYQLLSDYVDLKIQILSPPLYLIFEITLKVVFMTFKNTNIYLYRSYWGTTMKFDKLVVKDQKPRRMGVMGSTTVYT